MSVSSNTFRTRHRKRRDSSLKTVHPLVIGEFFLFLKKVEARGFATSCLAHDLWPRTCIAPAGYLNPSLPFCSWANLCFHVFGSPLYLWLFVVVIEKSKYKRKFKIQRKTRRNQNTVSQFCAIPSGEKLIRELKSYHRSENMCKEKKFRLKGRLQIPSSNL